MTSAVPDHRYLLDVGSSSEEGQEIINARIDSFPPEMMAEPTDGRPGTVEKLAAMYHRWWAGLPLWHPDDNNPADPDCYAYSLPQDFMTDEERY
jgi:hypothetical protein